MSPRMRDASRRSADWRLELKVATALCRSFDGGRFNHRAVVSARQPPSIFDSTVSHVHSRRHPETPREAAASPAAWLA